MKAGTQSYGVLLSKNLYEDIYPNTIAINGDLDTINNNFIKPNILQNTNNFIFYCPNKTLYNKYFKLLNENNYQIKLIDSTDKNTKYNYNPLMFDPSVKTLTLIVNQMLTSTKFMARKKLDPLLLSKALGYLLLYVSTYVARFEENEEKNFNKVLFYIEQMNNNNNILDEKIFKIIVKTPMSMVSNQLISSFAAFKALPLDIQNEAIYQITTMLKSYSKLPIWQSINKTNSIKAEDMVKDKTAVFIIKEETNDINPSCMILSQFLMIQNEYDYDAKQFMYSFELQYLEQMFNCNSIFFQNKLNRNGCNVVFYDTDKLYLSENEYHLFFETNYKNVSMQLIINNEDTFIENFNNKTHRNKLFVDIFMDFKGNSIIPRKLMGCKKKQYLNPKEVLVINVDYEAEEFEDKFFMVVDDIVGDEVCKNRFCLFKKKETKNNLSQYNNIMQIMDKHTTSTNIKNINNWEF